MFKTWLCVVCGLIYDEALGWPQDGIIAGTRWEDVPEDWKCPECGVGKSDFEMLDISPMVAAAANAAERAPLPVPPAPVPQHLPAAAVVRQPIVIIGSGYAGYGLAQALRKADPKIEIRVLTQESGHLYSKPALSVGLAQSKNADALASETPLAIEQRLDIRIYPHCTVERINSATRRLVTNFGEMEYGQLVLANGASPIRLSIDGAGQDAMLSVNNLHDYQGFRQRLLGAKRIAILGDGLIGCEFANDLAASGFDVSVIGLGQWPMARLLPAEAGQHLQAALADLGVRWHLQSSVQRIEQGADAYHLQLTCGQHLEADLILSAIGLRPNLELAATAGLAVDRGIKVDEHLQTSQPGIYALGDCIEIEGQLLPYLAPINQGIQALSQTLLGKPTAVSYPLMPVTVKTPAAPLCILPPVPGAAGEWRCTPTDDGLCAGFFTANEALGGFVLLGRQAQVQRSNWLQSCQLAQRAVA